MPSLRGGGCGRAVGSYCAGDGRDSRDSEEAPIQRRSVRPSKSGVVVTCRVTRVRRRARERGGGGGGGVKTKLGKKEHNHKKVYPTME